MGKYRLADEIDLTRHVRTPAGERYFHKPIGAPIGGGGGRATKSVTARWQIPGQATHDAAVARFAKPGAPAKLTGANAVFGPMLAATKPRTSRGASSPIKPADLPDHATMLDVKSWYDEHKPTKDQSEGLATDLGLDPALSDKSVRELRKLIKSRTTQDSDREKFKSELAKRILVAKAAAEGGHKLSATLVKKLEEKPGAADLAPTIGETLAAHPHLGPLAHIWDRLRLAGYNFKKGVKKGEFTDELPRIIARNVGSVLIMFMALHFGLEIPGLGGGG